ncbi:hypothetical protein F5J12DRAFT_906995 [Pisolithus orientalis]|uniref:uncharacterized protein n=1 Tax=Pisolithus orientalis TaxID=936130 RepID=UPI0022249672|nr:uncharacterized protein F5J12DRAFT_906995 [Pisolithus orientalis]KAI5997286.1 hypothetical protein F5J12DRAFT_906995 [Pisolithus orientalis]
MSSPTASAQERRKGQYKSLLSYRTPESSSVSRRLFSTANVGQLDCSTDPTKSFLRERFQARCREHARKARQRAVSERRGSMGSSDAGLYFDDEMDCDAEETDEDVLQDELFRRIVESANHRARHAFRLSYSLEVGSSFDPDLEDVSVWESELRGSVHAQHLTHHDPEEELVAYAEEYAALADFADIDLSAEEFSSWSDVEDDSLGRPQAERTVADQYDQDMDMS